MRTLGAVLSYYHDEKNQTYMNPVQTLSKRGKRKTKTGKWFKVGRRTSLVKSSELPAWHKAVMALSNTDMRDFLLFLLFTGLRRGEAAKLKWQDVDFVEKVYKVLDPKNGIDVITI
jgi:integrase